MPGKLAGAVNRRLAPFAFRRVLRMRNQRPIVSFTFDDAPRSAYSEGAAILETAGGCGTYYACGGLCDTWADGMEFLKSGDLADLTGRGHELACHTFSHVRIPSLNRGGIDAEFDRNQRFVEEACGDVMLRNFSYPFGDVSPASRLAAQARFSSCRGIHPGVNHGRVDLGLLKAVSIYDRVFDRQAVERHFDQAGRSNGWLIFYTHDIGKRPSPYGTAPDVLAGLAKRAVDLGFTILTVRNALGEIGFRGVNDAAMIG